MSLYAGFDLGGTHLKCGLVDQNGEIVYRARESSPQNIEDLLKLLYRLWRNLDQSAREKVRAAGFGFPGIFSLEKKKILQSPNYASLDNFDLIPALSSFVDVPFWVNNDANLAAYGEFRAGKGKGAQSMVFLTIGTGVGSGVILEGKLWMGKSGYGGELGHLVVNHEGEKCRCGGQGCLETEVSAPKIVRNYCELKGEEIEVTAEQVYARARSGEKEAVTAFTRAGYFLGIGLAAVINFLNPEKIFLGGAVMNAGAFLLSPALDETRRRAYRASFESTTIERAALGNEAGVIGSALWAEENLKKANLPFNL
ncbi:MAG: ROK family protein [Candidatus Aminicenantales bacterium]